MTPDEILEQVDEMLDKDQKITQFPDFKGALIGWAYPWDSSGNRPLRLIYSASKCLDIMVDEGMSHEEALEWLSINTEGGYLGVDTPIIMHGEVWA